MGTTDIPEEPEGFTETVEEEFIETVFGRVIKHPKRIITHPEGKSEEVSPVPQTSIVRLRSEGHNTEQGVHIYQVELVDSRYFSKPLVFEIVFDSEGQIIEPEIEE